MQSKKRSQSHSLPSQLEKIGHFQPDQSIEKELQKGLETGITQVLEPDMNDTDRLYINIESNTYSQAFSHLFIYAGEWGKSEIMEQVFDDLESGLDPNQGFNEKDTFHIVIQRCK